MTTGPLDRAPTGTAAVISVSKPENTPKTAGVPLKVTPLAPARLVPSILTAAPTLPVVGNVFTNGPRPTESLNTVPQPFGAQFAPPNSVVPALQAFGRGCYLQITTSCPVVIILLTPYSTRWQVWKFCLSQQLLLAMWPPAESSRLARCPQGDRKPDNNNGARMRFLLVRLAEGALPKRKTKRK
jgi:hypothetical protein